MKFKTLAVTTALLAASTSASAEFIETTQLTQISSYEQGTMHFVWMSTGVSSDCAANSPGNPTIGFDEAQPGGKSLLAILTAAMLNKRNVSLRITGCKITEAYLK